MSFRIHRKIAQWTVAACLVTAFLLPPAVTAGVIEPIELGAPPLGNPPPATDTSFIRVRAGMPWAPQGYFNFIGNQMSTHVVQPGFPFAMGSASVVGSIIGNSPEAGAYVELVNHDPFDGLLEGGADVELRWVSRIYDETKPVGDPLEMALRYHYAGALFAQESVAGCWTRAAADCMVSVDIWSGPTQTWMTLQERQGTADIVAHNDGVTSWASRNVAGVWAGSGIDGPNSGWATLPVDVGQYDLYGIGCAWMEDILFTVPNGRWISIYMDIATSATTSPGASLDGYFAQAISAFHNTFGGEITALDPGVTFSQRLYPEPETVPAPGALLLVCAGLATAWGFQTLLRRRA
ncbi:MAG: hypothetical protein V2A58_10055 [Planctomycetota bacterium]